MKRAFTLIEALIIVGIVAIAAAILLPVFFRPNYGGHGASCQANLKQIGLGVMQYTQDYNQKSLLIYHTSTTGWADVLQPYLKSTQLFQCPATSNASGVFASDYFYNSRLDGTAWNKLKQPALIVLSGDGEDEAPTWNSWGGLPADAATNSKSPSQRHMRGANSDIGGANYLFADGHVKWYTPDKISSTYAAPTSRPTFAAR